MTSIPALHLTSDPSQVDWQALALVFERAPLGKRDPAQLKQVFANSGCCCFAFRSNQIVGAGRALTDRMNYAFVLDVVVAPEFQRLGYGREIMNYLAAHCEAKNLVLHAVPEMQSFYAGLGYRKMKTAMALFTNPAFWQEQGYIE